MTSGVTHFSVDGEWPVEIPEGATVKVDLTGGQPTIEVSRG